MKVIFLYTEIAGYVLSCLNTLAANRNLQVHLVRYPVNAEAPFQFTGQQLIQIYNREDFNEEGLLNLVDKLNPDIIVCSGWVDKTYLNVCRKSGKGIKKILTLDTQWQGSIKQYLASFISRFTLIRVFKYAWVPGSLQKEYAIKLGFKKQNILTGFYSADFDLFHQIYKDNKESKIKSFPKRFIYSGRYYDFKGIKDLWNAFIELQEQEPNEWELWCMGTGDIEPINHSKIKHLGFVQPGDMPIWLSQTGVFVLPSHFEPWGVVVHEFAAAGFPLILSSAVGARTAFLENEHNGYLYTSGEKDELKVVLKKVMQLPEKSLIEMGELSVEKAKAITPVTWADTLVKLINSTQE